MLHLDLYIAEFKVVAAELRCVSLQFNDGPTIFIY